MSDIVIRPPTHEDVAFVRHTWRVAFATSDGALGAESEHFHEEMTRIMNRLLAKATVRIACVDDAPDVVVGFAVFTGPELHWIYVKGDFRRMAIVPQLLKGAPIDRYTFTTRQLRSRLKPRERGWLFTPRWTI